MNSKTLPVLSAAILCLLSLSFESLGLLKPIEDKIYDIYLTGRPERRRFDNVVLVDIDDAVIAEIGTFPLPRSLTAEAYLILKEYDARYAVMDIEYVDSSPTDVDENLLNKKLKVDFETSFANTFSYINQFYDALKRKDLKFGRDSDETLLQIKDLLEGERDTLYNAVEEIKLSNDLYLAQASALYGNVWGTLNMQEKILPPVQAERRVLAEDKFSYDVHISKDFKWSRHTKNADVLVPIPVFALTLAGAGFTNAIVDSDGIRRRTALVQEVNGRYYLQLVFSPLMDYLGQPEIILHENALLLHDAKNPAAGNLFDITIPLDDDGLMYLDWAKTDYNNSFKHISFLRFCREEVYETPLLAILKAIGAFDAVYFGAPARRAKAALDIYATAETARGSALSLAINDKPQADVYFLQYLNHKNNFLQSVQSLCNYAKEDEFIHYINNLKKTYPSSANIEYIDGNLKQIDILKTRLDEYNANNQIIKDTIAGKFCVFGRTDTGTTDIGSNPFYGKYVNVGTHPTVLDTILSNSFITPVSTVPLFPFVLVLIPLFIFFTNALKQIARLIISGTIALALILFLFFLFYFKGLFIAPFALWACILGSLVMRELIFYLYSDKEKQFIRKAFSTYISDDIVNQIIDDPKLLHLGGSEHYMTALFTDIQGFSTFSEKMSPTELVNLLNDYLSAMSNIILEEGGTIDKYEGDAIIAFFGAPVEVPNHALLACRAAIKMKRIEKELNRRYLKTGLTAAPIYTRVGINTGRMVAGNMGTEKKMNYTIMGHAVNLAARLEGVNKQYGTYILCSQETKDNTKGKILCRKLDRVRVVGVKEPVRLYEVLDLIEEAPVAEKARVKLFEAALALYEGKKWAEAEAAFSAVLKKFKGDKVANLFMQRANHLKNHPPPPSWDCSISLTKK